MNHSCGGDVEPLVFDVEIMVNDTLQKFEVSGYRCLMCGEKFMSRDEAVRIENEVRLKRDSASHCI